MGSSLNASQSIITSTLTMILGVLPLAWEHKQLPGRMDWARSDAGADGLQPWASGGKMGLGLSWAGTCRANSSKGAAFLRL